MLNYIFLLEVFGFANTQINSVISRYGGAGNAAREILSGGSVPDIGKEQLRALYESAGKAAEHCARNGIRICTREDNDYPPLLKNISNPPAALFVDGDITACDRHALLTVAGIKPDKSSVSAFAAKTAKAAVHSGITVVGGLVSGIDKVVRDAVLEENGRTVSVLMSGFSESVLESTKETRELIKKNGGVIISELPPSQAYKRACASAAARVLAGISDATVITGARNNCFAARLAAAAAEEGRGLFIVPPPDTLSDEYSDIVGFLKNGARLLFDFGDIACAMADAYHAAAKKRHGMTESPLSFFPDPKGDGNENDPQPAVYEKMSGAVSNDGGGYSYTDLKGASKEELARLIRAEYRAISEKTHNVSAARRHISDMPHEKIGGNTDSRSERSGYVGAVEKAVGDTSAKKEYRIDDMTDTQRLILKIIEEHGGSTVDMLMMKTDIDFSELSITLAELEMDGIIICGPGNVYVLT